MRRGIVVSAVILLAVGAFGAGVVAAVIRGWGANSATIPVSNQTGHPIAELNIQHESCHGTGTLAVGRIEASGQRHSAIAMCGTGAFTIRAKLESGAIVE